MTGPRFHHTGGGTKRRSRSFSLCLVEHIGQRIEGYSKLLLLVIVLHNLSQSREGGVKEKRDRGCARLGSCSSRCGWRRTRQLRGEFDGGGGRGILPFPVPVSVASALMQLMRCVDMRRHARG